jgi:hypothetical protein
MTKEEIELKIEKEFKEKKIFIGSILKDCEKADRKESAVNAFLACNLSVTVKIYTEQLLGREMSWKTFKEYMLSNIDNMSIVTISSILLDEDTRRMYEREMYEK